MSNSSCILYKQGYILLRCSLNYVTMGPYYKNCCRAFATFDIDQLIDDFQARFEINPEKVLSISFTKRYFTLFDVVKDWFLGKKCIEGVCYEIVIKSKHTSVIKILPEISGEHLCALSETIKKKHPHILITVYEGAFISSN